MSEATNRDFVYNVPGKVLFDADLTLIDFKVYAVIRSFMDTTGAAYPSNGWLADKLGISYKSASRSLNKLAKRNHIAIIERDGRRFCIVGQQIPLDLVRPQGVDKVVQGGGQECPGGVDKNVHQLDQRSITTKSINNMCVEEQKISKEDINRFFEMMWAEYPLKKAKQKALEALSKKLVPHAQPKAKELAMEIWIGLGAHIQENKAMRSLKDQGADIFVPELPHLATWINNQRWLDGYRTPEEILKQAAPKRGILDIDKVFGE